MKPKKKPGLIGRPSKYKATVGNLKQVERMAAKGFTNMDFADVFGVDHSTLDRWLDANQAFRGAIKKGRDASDKRVEKSLYQRAMGYSHKAVKIMVIDHRVVREDYIEHYPPDTMAMMYWLNNRRPRDWRHKQTVENVNGGPRQINVIVSSDNEKAKFDGGMASAIEAIDKEKA